jgi:hypothetical protein
MGLGSRRSGPLFICWAARTLGAIRDILSRVEGTDFDEHEFFQRIAAGGARALLIGRRALVVLGLPLLTADYDFWVHPEDTGAFNASVEALGLVASHTPEEARNRGRYVLENDEHVDVLAARTVSTPDGLVAHSTICGAVDRRCASIPKRPSPFQVWPISSSPSGSRSDRRILRISAFCGPCWLGSPSHE